MCNEREVFANNLRRIIDSSGIWTQSKLAAELEVSKGTMHDYISGKAYPRPARMTRLCQILGVSQYDLTTASYAEEGVTYYNQEVANIAQNIYENPDARGLYTAILELEPEEIQALKIIVMKLKSKK